MKNPITIEEAQYLEKLIKKLEINLSNRIAFGEAGCDLACHDALYAESHKDISDFIEVISGYRPKFED